MTDMKLIKSLENIKNFEDDKQIIARVNSIMYEYFLELNDIELMRRCSGELAYFNYGVMIGYHSVKECYENFFIVIKDYCGLKGE